MAKRFKRRRDGRVVARLEEAEIALIARLFADVEACWSRTSVTPRPVLGGRPRPRPTWPATPTARRRRRRTPAWPGCCPTHVATTPPRPPTSAD